MKYLTLLIIFISTSCILVGKNEEDSTKAEINISNEWLYATKLQDLKTNGEPITRPPGILQLLFRLTIPSIGGVNLKTQCVYYQVPYKKIPGVIRIEELKSEAVCSETGGNDPWILISDVKNLAVKLENFKLQFNFKINNTDKSWTFPLPNINSGIIHEKYQALREKKLFPGMSILRITDESFENESNKYLGRLSDRYSRGSSIRCEQVNKSCQTIGENRCDECRYGWYQVVDYQCAQGGSKFCGQNHCGEKSEPACPRGSRVVNVEEAGICQNDLTAVLNADHILVCQ